MTTLAGATIRIAVLAEAARARAELASLGDSAEEAGGRIKTGLGNLAGSLKGGLAGLAVGVGAALTAGIGSALEQGKLNAKLGAQLGLTTEEAARVGKLAGSVYADGFGQDVGQVNEAIKGVYQNIGEGNDQWTKEITSQVLSVSDVFEQDLGGTTAAVGQLMKTGLAKNAEEALDILTVGFQSGADKAGDLLDTFTEYGTQFRKFGLDGQTATGLLSQGLQAGARDADTVADALKEFSILALDGNKKTAAGFESLGLSARQMTADIAGGGPKAAAALDQTLDRLRAVEDPAKRSQLAVALFGTKAEDLGDALFALDPSSAVQALGAVEGAAGKLGDTMGESAGAKIEKFKRGLTQGFTEAVGGALGALEGLSDVLIKGDFSAAFKTAFNVEEDAPIVGFLFGVREKVIELGTAVAEKIMPPLRELWASISGDLIPALSGWYQAIVPIYVWLAEKLFPVVGTVFGAIVDVIRGALDIVIGVVKVFTGILTGDWSKAWEGIKQILSGAWTIIKAVVSAAIAVVKGVFSLGLDALWTLAKALPGRIIGALAALGGLLLGWGQAAWQKAKDATVTGVTNAVTAAKTLPGRVLSGLGNLGNTLVGAGRQLMEGFARGISERIDAAVQKVRDGVNRIKGLLPGSPIKWGPLTGWNNGGAGKRLMGLLEDGIRSGAPGVSAALSDGIAVDAQIGSVGTVGAAAGRGTVTINGLTLQVQGSFDLASPAQRKAAAEAMVRELQEALVSFEGSRR